MPSADTTPRSRRRSGRTGKNLQRTLLTNRTQRVTLLWAFQTAYLKANYPAEYMASVLTHNMNDIKKVTFFMEECKRMGLAVLGPDCE